MRRTRLIWFALGAASVAHVAVLAKLTEQRQQQVVVAHLELVEPLPVNNAWTDESFVANRVGKMARECGGKFFELTAQSPDHSPTLELALTPENKTVVECLMSKTSEQSIKMNIIYRKATNAQTH